MQGFIASRWEAIKVLGDEGGRVDEGGVWGGWRRAGESGGHAWTQPDPVTGGMSAGVSAAKETVARQNTFIMQNETGRHTRPVGSCLERRGLDPPVRGHTGIIKRRKRDAQRGQILLYLAEEGENVVDLGLLVLSVFREGGTDDLESRMRVRPLDGDNAVAHLEFFLGARQVVRINPPKGFNVLEYLVVLVRQLDTMSDDVVPPTLRSPTTSTSQVGTTHHLSKPRGGARR